MKQFIGNKYVKGITQFIQAEHFGPKDFIDWYCESMGLSREEYMAGYRVPLDLRLGIHESKRDWNDPKPGPNAYHTGLDDDEIEDKEEQMKKQAKMDDDDPKAYKEMPGSKRAREEGRVKTSKFTKSYHELYGDDNNESYVNENQQTITATGLDAKDKSELLKMGAIVQRSGPGWYITFDDNNKLKIFDYLKKVGAEVNENLNEDVDGDNLEMLKLMNKAMKAFPGSAKQRAIIRELNILRSKNGLEPLQESFLNEEKAEGDRSPIDNDSIETGLKNKSEETGVPIQLLRIIMRRGMAAWRTGHRPGATQEQWGYARINSFLSKQPGTWSGADADVAKEVRDGGHDKKLKKG